MRASIYMMLCWVSLAVTPTWVAACGSDGDGDNTPDAAIADAAAPDAATPDASGPDASSAADAAAVSCAPQTIEGCPEPCATVVGAYWDGDSCEPIVCCCQGPDCDQTYDTAELCNQAHADCALL